MIETIKNAEALGVILLTEYHASSIRLPASDIADAVFLSPKASYSAYAEWYSLREFERRIEYH